MGKAKRREQSDFFFLIFFPQFIKAFALRDISHPTFIFFHSEEHNIYQPISFQMTVFCKHTQNMGMVTGKSSVCQLNQQYSNPP